MAPFLVVVYTDSRKFVDLTACIVRLLPMVLGSAELARIHAFDERISLENYGRMIRFYGSFIRGTGSALDVKAVYGFFKSVRLTIVLILAIAVLSLLASLVPQGRSDAWYQSHYSPGFVAACPRGRIFPGFSALPVFWSRPSFSP